MQRAGYRTAFFGKSHLGGDIRDPNGNLIRGQKDISRMDLSKGVRNSINEYGFDYSYFLPSGIQHAPFAFFENMRLLRSLKTELLRPSIPPSRRTIVAAGCG